MTGESNWATGTLKEVPFWRDGMTPEEYEEERTYYCEHWLEYTRGEYRPLWMQREKSESGPLKE